MIRKNGERPRSRRVWFITGASRGFGLEIARQALARGDAVVATARDTRPLERMLAASGRPLVAIPLDVTDERQAGAAVAQAVARFGRIDVLVNNAGRGLLGAVEEASAAEVRTVFETNVFGVLAVTRAVLPVMRRQRSGRVLNVSSVGGISASAGWGLYCATKFALEGLSEAMHTELAPLGIEVVIVEPGAFRTDSSTRARCTGSPGRSTTTTPPPAGRVHGPTTRITPSSAIR